MDAFNFSTREILFVMTIIALSLGWWTDSAELARRLEEHRLWSKSFFVRLDTIQETDLDGDSIHEFSLLVFALFDPANSISKFADDKLRKLSGRSQGFGDIERHNEFEKLVIANRWIDWYVRHGRSAD